MSLDSSSTLADAIAQYQDNLLWEGSPAKAELALEAVRYILINRPNRQSQSGRSFDFESLADEKKKLEAYVSKFGTTASAGRTSFVRCRGVQI